jgi:hypothetical protein
MRITYQNNRRFCPSLQELVTEENLRSLNGKNILTDIFVLIASLFWGAFFSVLITMKASSGVAEATTQALLIYQKVFLCAGVGFALLAFIFLYITYSGIQGIRKSTFTEPET